MNIGVFDSGLGGLAILKHILKEMPEYNYVYLGDNARVPYGGRSPEVLYEFTRSAVEFLFKQNCQLVVVACNTATANALRRIQQQYLPRAYPDRRVLGVIRPTIEAVHELHSKRVGVIATRSTVASQSFPLELHKLNPSLEVYQGPCPLLVPIIEEGELEWEGLPSILKKYLTPLLEHHIDSLILGCTHYELIADMIQAEVGSEVKLVGEGAIVAKKLQNYLHRHPEIDIKLEKHSERTYCVTDLNERFERLTKLFLGDHFRDEDTLQLVHL